MRGLDGWIEGIEDFPCRPRWMCLVFQPGLAGQKLTGWCGRDSIAAMAAAHRRLATTSMVIRIA